MVKIKTSIFPIRLLARIIIEAKTPLAIGNGEKDIITDALVARDFNNLPYIPGTSIAGVVRSMLKQIGVDTDNVFGFQKGKDGWGSKIIFTEAKILDSKHRIVDGMDCNVFESDDLLRHFAQLPIRQHVRINEHGTAVKNGKFDEQIIYSGTRFCFEIEMLAAEKDDKTTNYFNQVLRLITNRTFRIGGGTRCGFGEIEVKEMKYRFLDLRVEDDLQIYIDKSNNLIESAKWGQWNDYSHDETDSKGTKQENERYTRYRLELRPVDFFLFGSGLGDEGADMTPVKTQKIEWNDNHGELKENLVLIPATSVKGALAHRVTYYWNKNNQYYVGDQRAKVGNDNLAVRALFGYEDYEEKTQQRGNLIFSDIIASPEKDKVINHVSIDRFTGGARDGALFTEKTTYGKDKKYTLEIILDAAAFDKVIIEDANIENPKSIIKESLKDALMDICNGMLPLGGGVNRGNGIFNGDLYIDGIKQN